MSSKSISVDLTSKKTREEIEEEKHIREQEKKTKKRQKRVVTNHKKWEFTEEELQCSQQLQYIMQITNEKENDTKQYRCIYDSFRQKLSSYRTQDTIKDRYSEENFTDIENKEASRKSNIDALMTSLTSVAPVYKKLLLTNFWDFLTSNEQEVHANYLAEKYLIPLAEELQDGTLANKLILYKSI